MLDSVAKNFVDDKALVLVVVDDLVVASDFIENFFFFFSRSHHFFRPQIGVVKLFSIEFSAIVPINLPESISENVVESQTH